jgi:hypothetical protein
MVIPDPTTLTWRKSSFSSSSGANCVEIAHIPGGVAIHDSKNPTGPILTFPTRLPFSQVPLTTDPD